MHHRSWNATTSFPCLQPAWKRGRNDHPTGGRFFAGVWESTPGKWAIRYSENEFCHMTAGRVRISDRNGNQREFGAGDAFVIPAGFEGTWEVLETARKLYAIYEP